MCLSFLCDEVRLLLLMLPGTAGGLVVVPLMPTKIAAKMYDCRLMMAMMVVVMTSDCQWHATFWPWTFNRVLIWKEDHRDDERESVQMPHTSPHSNTLGHSEWYLHVSIDVRECACLCCPEITLIMLPQPPPSPPSSSSRIVCIHCCPKNRFIEEEKEVEDSVLPA